MTSSRIAIALSLLLAAGGAVAGTVPDAWSGTVVLRSADGTRWVAPIHLALMPGGELAGIAQTRLSPDGRTELDRFVFALEPSPLGTQPPAERLLEPQDVPFVAEGLSFMGLTVDDYLYCTGHAHTADGRLFAAGGQRVITAPDGEQAPLGLDYALVGDGSRWLRVAEKMVGLGPEGTALRWYPTVTRLADGSMLVTGGYERVEAGNPERANRSVELFDPASRSWQLVSAHEESPAEIFAADYSQVFQLPAAIDGADVLVIGDDSQPALLAPRGEPKWRLSAAARPERLAGEKPNEQSSAVLLPLRLEDDWGYAAGSVLVVGGQDGTSHRSAADLYDPSADAWTRHDLGAPRGHPATVLLPDGRVLVLAGHSDEEPDPSRVAQYVDPAEGFRVDSGTATMEQPRGYHTAAALLPDGRVVVAGGREEGWFAFGTETPTLAYYHPSYLGAESRPSIDQAPAEVALGESFEVEWTSPAAPGEWVLMGLPSMTHSLDMNQRRVELAVESTDPPGSRTGGGSGTATLVAPAEAGVAPPGPYMLFLVDGERVPSVGWMVSILP